MHRGTDFKLMTELPKCDHAMLCEQSCEDTFDVAKSPPSREGLPVFVPGCFRLEVGNASGARNPVRQMPLS